MRASDLEAAVLKLLRLAVTDLPQDVEKRLLASLNKESNPTARNQLEAILENVRLARANSIPICQDTGIPIFYVNVGSEFPLLGSLESILIESTKRATKEIPLRPNTVDPIVHKNPGDNTGAHMPWINWTLAKGTDLQITVFPKGGGSENVCRLGMLTPGKGILGMKQFVIDSVIDAGANPCPPTIVGVGIGGGADICLKLAKETLLRTMGERNPNPEIAKLEEELLAAVNRTGIGPMGLGGDTTALDVHVEVAMRHPASYPVGLAFQCWAARRASATITGKGEIRITSHKAN
jgi:fumarate hydratase subunit alpha